MKESNAPAIGRTPFQKWLDKYQGLFYLIPWIIGFVVFKAVPFGQSLYYSFTDMNFFKSGTQFVGLANYITAFTTTKITKALIITFKYAFITVPLKLVFALFIAYILNFKIACVNLFRTVYYIPSILGGSVAIAVLWKAVFSVDGLLNTVLRAVTFGLVQGPEWLSDPSYALCYARDNSMRALMLDKIARSELIVFNRAEAVNNDAARQELHKLVRQASRKCDIAYEFADGSVAYDDIPDPLPFDLNKPMVEIGDDDFGIWYMDCQDEPQKYTGKTVKFLAQVCQTNRAGKNSFVPGRFAMTCCVQDIQFVGFPCSYDGYKALEQRAWVTVTAKVNYKFHNIYRGKGPVLTAISVEPAEKPLNDVVTFS